jgi:aminopeptidase N
MTSPRYYSRLKIVRADATPAGTPLTLDGQQLELLSLELDGEPLAADRYQVDADRLTLFYPPANRLNWRSSPASARRTTPRWKVSTNPAVTSAPSAKRKVSARSPIFSTVPM